MVVIRRRWVVVEEQQIDSQDVQTQVDESTLLPWADPYIAGLFASAAAQQQEQHGWDDRPRWREEAEEFVLAAAV